MNVKYFLFIIQNMYVSGLSQSSVALAIVGEYVHFSEMDTSA